MSDRKTIVVDIVSDSKKFLSGFEEAIKAIEKTAKKTDILGGMQDEIDELRKSIDSIEKSISGIKPKIDDSAIQNMQKQMTSLGGKIKTLRADVKDIKLQVDTSTGEELVKLFNKINNEFRHIQDQAKIFKGLGIGLNTNNINSNIEEINKLKQSIEELTNIQNDLRTKSNTKFDDLTTKEAQKQLDALIVKYNQLIDSMSDDDIIKTGSLAKDIKTLQGLLGKNLIPEKELKDVLLSATDVIEDRITEIRSKISSLSSEISAEVSTFEVKDGKISVKLDLATTVAQLKKTVINTLSQVQDSISNEPLLVPLRFTSAYKTKVVDELDELDKIAQGMKKSKAKDEITKQVENLRKQILDRDFKLEFKTNLPELLNNIIKPDMAEIQKILKESKLYLYPQLKIDDESEKAIKEQIEKICKGLKIDLGVSNLNIDSLLSEEEIKKINEQLKKLQVSISPTVDLTDKDIEKINKSLISKLDKLHIEVDTTKLQEGLKSAINTSLIDNWRSKFISAIDDVCSKIEKSFDKVSKGQFYETMKGWSEADKIMRDHRRGSTSSHGTNTLFEKNATGELERKAYANTKTGTISNAYIVDQFGSVSGEIKNQLKELYGDIKKIGEIYDTSLHSHPVHNKQALNTDKILKTTSFKKDIHKSLLDNIMSQINNQDLTLGSNKDFEKKLQDYISQIYDAILIKPNIRGKQFIDEFNTKIQYVLGEYLKSIQSNINTDNIGLQYNDLSNILQNTIKGNESKYLMTSVKASGSDLTFSSSDLLSYSAERINDGIKKLMIESNGKINELDLSTVDDRIVKSIVDEYGAKINSELKNTQSQYVTSHSDGTATVDYSKRAEISNKLLSDIIEQQISSFNSTNKTKYSSKASDYLKQYDIEALKLDPEDIVKEQQEISKLVQLLGEMSKSLTEINKKDFKLNTESIDAITKQIQALLDAIKELGKQFKTVDVANFNISVEPFERIITTLQEMSGTFEKAFSSTTSSKNEIEDVSGLSKQLQNVIKKIKEKNELFEKEVKIVTKTIPDETEKIGKLVSALEHVNRLLTEINDTVKQLDFSNINNLGQLNKLKPEKITSISTALSSLAESVNNINIKDTSFLSSINEILSKADELKNLASILKESKSKISEVEKTVKGKDKTEEKQLSDKYSILKDNLKEILRLTKEYEKADAYTKENIKKQLAQYQDRADTIQLEIWELDKVNEAEQNRVEILREQIALEEGRQQNKEFLALEKQESKAESLAESLREQNEYLIKDSNEWKHALELLALYKDELKDVVSITRNVRLDESTGFKAISYKFSSSDGSSKTVGANSNLLIDNTKIANLTELYAKLKKSVNEYYSAQSKIIKGDKSDKTQTESLQAYNNILQVQKEIAYWKQKGLEPSEEQLQIEQKILSVTSTLQEQQKQSGLDNMYQTVLNTITRLNKKTEEVNNLRLKSDGTSEFVQSIQNAQDHVSNLIGTLRSFKFSDFFSQDALQSFGLNGDSLLFDNGDLDSLKWVINQLPFTEEQLNKIHDVLDNNVKITEKNIALKNKASESKKIADENARQKEAADNLEMINQSLSRQYELTNKLHSLEKDGRSEEAKVVNDELVAEIRNCEALVAGYKTFDDVVKDVNTNLQQVFSSHKFDYDKFNAKILDDKNKEQESAITKHNKELISSYQNLEKQLVEYYELSEKQTSGNITDKELEKLKQIEQAWIKAINKKDEYYIQSGGNSDVEKQAKKIQDGFLGSQSVNYSYAIEKYIQDAQKNINKLKQGNFTDEFISKLETAQILINEINSKPLNPLNSDDLALVGKFKSLMEEINIGKNLDSNKTRKEVSTIKLLRNIWAELDKNSAMSKELRLEFEKLADELENAGRKIPIDEFDKFNNRFVELQMNVQKAGKTGKSFFDLITSKVKGMSASLIAQYLSLYDLVRYAQQSFETVKEYDKALTGMKKVSDENIQTLKEFQTESFKLANAVGTTASQIQNSTADWMRLGESLEDAKQSAQATNILFNVSEFESIDAATDSLVSMSQAYKDLEKMDIVDIMNNIGNNYSISTDGLATALQKSASSLTTAGNDINEAVALITAGNAIAQDPDSVGAGIRTISLRLVGTKAAKEELEALGEETDDVITTTSKLRETIIAATKAASDDGKGFDILDANGNYKSTYEIMLGLSDLYDDIVAKDKELGTNNLNLLLETIAGEIICLKFMETYIYRTHLIALIA